MQHKAHKTLLLPMIVFMMQPFALHPMEEQATRKMVKVYSHGFGEIGSANGPTYPDAPGRLDKAVFYTKPAVHVLANYLKKKIDEGYDAIYLRGRSCGAGIAINCLEKLINYDAIYFKDTAITSQQDAQKIINAINSGALELTVPLLSIKKTKIIDTVSNIGGYGIATVGAGALFYAAGMAALPPVGLVSACYVAYTVGSSLKGLSVCSSDERLVPIISGQHYDSEHIKPIDAVEYLRRYIKCSVLLHFCKNDGVLTSPDEDTIKVYECFRQGNENNTYIIVTDDDTHNKSPYDSQYQQLSRQFRKMVYYGDPKVSGNRPTVQELRQQIFGPSIFDYTFRRK